MKLQNMLIVNHSEYENSKKKIEFMTSSKALKIYSSYCSASSSSSSSSSSFFSCLFRLHILIPPFPSHPRSWRLSVLYCGIGFGIRSQLSQSDTLSSVMSVRLFEIELTAFLVPS
jgi:hypothetical protein